VAEAFQVVLARRPDGGSPKTHRRPPPGFFTTEGRGGSPGLGGGRRAPRAGRRRRQPTVPAGRAPWLVLEWITESRGRRFPMTLRSGERSRRFTALPPRHFGREDRRSTGKPGATQTSSARRGPSSYATQRLIPLARAGTRRAGTPRRRRGAAGCWSRIGCQPALRSWPGPPSPPARLPW